MAPSLFHMKLHCSDIFIFLSDNIDDQGFLHLIIS